MSELADLILDGSLIPVLVFTDRETEDGYYGLCDEFSRHAPGGSDCNRAVDFLLRPSDELMQSADVIAALRTVKEER